MKALGQFIFWVCILGASALAAASFSMFDIHKNYPADANTFFLLTMGAAMIVLFFGLAARNLLR